MEQEIKGYIDNYVQLIIENLHLASIVIIIAVKLSNDIKSLSKLSKSMPDRLEMINDVGKSVRRAIDEKLKTSLLGQDLRTNFSFSLI